MSYLFKNQTANEWELAKVLHYPVTGKVVLQNDSGIPLGTNKHTPTSEAAATYYADLTPSMIHYIFRRYHEPNGEKPNLYEFSSGALTPHPVVAGQHVRCLILNGIEQRKAVLSRILKYRTPETYVKAYAASDNVIFRREAKHLLSARAENILTEFRKRGLTGNPRFSVDSYLKDYQSTEFGRCWTIASREALTEIIRDDSFLNIAKYLGVVLFGGWNSDGTGTIDIRVISFDERD